MVLGLKESHQNDQLPRPPAYFVHHTFIDIMEPEDKDATSRRRARSCGDRPFGFSPVSDAGTTASFATTASDCETATYRSREEASGSTASAGSQGTPTDSSSESGCCEAASTVAVSSVSTGCDSESLTALRSSRTNTQESRLWSEVEDQEAEEEEDEELIASHKKSRRRQRQRQRQRARQNEVAPQIPQTRPEQSASSCKVSASEGSTWLEGCTTVAEVLQYFTDSRGELGITDLITALHLVAKCSENSDNLSTRFAAPAILSEPQFMELIEDLSRVICELNNTRGVARTLWSLGKLGAHGRHVESIVKQVVEVAPPLLAQCSSQELSNMLWGLARLGTGPDQCCFLLRPQAVKLALKVVEASTNRVDAFSPQCLSNSLWAVAKLELRGRTADLFSRACLMQLRASSIFGEISPQGVANSLWAVAKLQLGDELATPFAVDITRQVMKTENMLQQFLPQELSMALWALARIAAKGHSKGHRGGKRKDGAPKEVETIALAIASEAFCRISEFSPQGLSNIAWALATMDLIHHEAARRFIIAVAAKSAPNLSAFPPQAIANFCWALGRVENAEASMADFGIAAAREATRRISEFSWQDLSGMINAMMRGGRVTEIQEFAASIVERAARSCHQIGTQALLNIALAAVRLQVNPEVVLALAYGIEQAFDGNMGNLNPIDRRQWQEVQRYCSGAAASQSHHLCYVSHSWEFPGLHVY